MKTGTFYTSKVPLLQTIQRVKKIDLGPTSHSYGYVMRTSSNDARAEDDKSAPVQFEKNFVQFYVFFLIFYF